MTTKTIGILLIAAILLIGAGYYIFPTTTSKPQENSLKEDIQNSETSAMRVEENAVVAPEQRPGNSVLVSLAALSSVGFVVIHEDKDGKPGTILGASSVLQAGENSEVRINLSRASKDGEKLHAMLHSDTNGDGVFTETDQPVQSKLGGPIEGWFQISSEAGEYTPVAI